MPKVQDRRQILLVGDSITQQSFWVEQAGFGASLAHWYSRAADVTSRGYSGYNTRWARWMLPRVFPAGSYESLVLATVFFGANDSVKEGESQHVPIAEYKDNLRIIVDHLRSLSPGVSIVLITPPGFVDTELWPTRAPSQVSVYIDAVRELYNEEQERGSSVGLVDLGDLEPSDMRDGLHFNSYGNAKVFARLQHVVRERFPLLSPDESAPGVSRLSPHFPPFQAFAGLSIAEAEELMSSWQWA